MTGARRTTDGPYIFEPLKQPARWRWAVARLLNTIPAMCWSYLVDWVYGPAHYTDPEERPQLRYCKQGTSCREDAERVGSCYCGKVKRDG